MEETLLPAVKAQLLGKDPFDTEEYGARLRYYAAGLSYRGGANIDIALWDLLGKACGQPQYKLLGGGKDRVIPYASISAPRRSGHNWLRSSRRTDGRRSNCGCITPR